MGEYIARFFIGGLAVSAFAVLGDMLKPKVFAGIFGAAPSIALATLGISMAKQGAEHGAIEGRSMIFGACGFLAYCLLAAYFVKKLKWDATKAALVTMPIWFLFAFGIWSLAGGSS